MAQTWEIGGALGGSGYIGDLNTNNPVKLSGGSAGIFLKRNFNGYISAKLNYTYGKISAADSNSNSQQIRDRNLSFHTPLKELGLLGEFNFIKFIPDAGRNKYTPYVYAGIGITAFAPRTVYGNAIISLRNLRTEGQPKPYSNSTLVIPYGAGFKYNFGGKWTVAADLGYRYSRTDYLDDVSGIYHTQAELPNYMSYVLSDRSGERNNGVNIGSPGSQRGDLKPHDTYMFFGFTLSYTFVTQKCYFEGR
ncbi:outer membrane beta-barrel protein [Mucilaginibacter sp. SD-g]|uniref:Outer membrane beta-barrel protein n=2 Tax=Mucilaginibacter segetis TaxID=2793071 RepID=A0A934PSN3_9SPHI|nr:outer membrane beta-barrel protein [Mucilaginibacter segetis]